MEYEETTYTIQELATKYKVDKKTMHNWLKPIHQELLDMYSVKKQRLRILLPKQVKNAPRIPFRRVF